MLSPKDTFSFNVASLLGEEQVAWSDSNKAFAASLFDVNPADLTGDIVLKVWPEMKLPQQVTFECGFKVEEEFFDYSSDEEHFDWYLNFADYDLFGFYNSSLMAQDELQVFEHPILAQLRNKLLSLDFFPETVDDNLRPTPITVEGAYRVCAVDTRPDEHGDSIYGNAFSEAPKEVISRRVTPIMPPTKSNILAIAALPARKGVYTKAQIENILITAFSGFYAARLTGDTSQKSRVNSGFWGCGAFGGNRTLMTIIQLVAASLAGVDLRYWAGDAFGAAIANDAYEVYQNVLKKSTATQDVIKTLVEMNFDWGISDGN